jgi:hypothetical protein
MLSTISDLVFLSFKYPSGAALAAIPESKPAAVVALGIPTADSSNACDRARPLLPAPPSPLTDIAAPIKSVGILPSHGGKI